MSTISSLPLLELRIEPHRGGGSEIRVLPDGRVELRVAGEPWRVLRTLDDSERAALRTAMEEAGGPGVPAVVPAAPPGSNPTRMTWRLRLADDVRDVVVEEWRAGVAPPLERLYAQIVTVPADADAQSRWSVRTPGGVIERRVLGEPAAIPSLAPLVAALYERPDVFVPVGDDTPAGELLVDVRYDSGDRLAVAADGRVFLTESGDTAEVTPFRDSELAALRDAIAATDWAAMPDPLTG